jgi:hypothetical protein
MKCRGGKRKAPRGRESGRTEGEADARMREEKKTYHFFILTSFFLVVEK